MTVSTSKSFSGPSPEFAKQYGNIATTTGQGSNSGTSGVTQMLADAGLNVYQADYFVFQAFADGARADIQRMPQLTTVYKGTELNLASRAFSSTSKFSGVAGNALGIGSIAYDSRSLAKGNLSLPRFAYHTAGTAGTIIAGTSYFAMPAMGTGLIGLALWDVEIYYDLSNWYLQQVGKEVANFNYQMSNGWVPGRR